MPRLTTGRIPSYRLHKQSGLAIVTLSGRDVTLGRHGTESSRANYNRVVAEWLAAGRRLPQDQPAVTVAEVIAAYWDHAQSYYRRPDGTPTDEIKCIRQALGPVRTLFAASPAAAFGPLALKAVREEMIRRGWCRTYVNSQAGRVRRMFKWAAENELIPPPVYHGLTAVSGLKAGRCAAPESAPVRPVAEGHVEAVLPFVSRQVGAMIRLQLLTGMRPGEVCQIRGADLDLTGSVWLYRPPTHKTAHHGHERLIYLGPQAQRVLELFLKPDPSAFVFSAADAESERRASAHRARKTPLGRGNRPGSNRRRSPRRRPSARYDVGSYRRAISRACRAADRAAHRECPAIPADRVVVPNWHPHQLRHTAATRLRKEYGLEAAQVILGHRTLSVTQVYAERNAGAARTIMAEVG